MVLVPESEEKRELPAVGTIMYNLMKSCCLKHWPCRGSRLCGEVVQIGKEECVGISHEEGTEDTGVPPSVEGGGNSRGERKD